MDVEGETKDSSPHETTYVKIDRIRIPLKQFTVDTLSTP